MTKTIELVMEEFAETLDAKAVCKGCRRPLMCSTCLFAKKGQPTEGF